MFAKSISLIFAVGALVGAVIYAQNKAEKGEKIRPVFESSKSGTPTPIETPKPVKPKNEEVQQKSDEKPVEKQTANEGDKPVKKKKKKKVMPTSKSLSVD